MDAFGRIGAFAIAARLALHVSGLTFREPAFTPAGTMPSLEQSYPYKRVLITGATSGLGRALT